MAYDLKAAPSPEAWLALDEGERIVAVREAHERARAPMGQSADAHAAIHVMIENRLAEGHAAVVRAYERLCAAGFDRHAVVHGLASVATRHMMMALEGAGFDPDAADLDYDVLDPAALRSKR